MARHRRLALAVGVGGGCLAIVGLAGVPSDLASWSAVLKVIGSNLGRWLLVIAGLGVICGAVLPWNRNYLTSGDKFEAAEGEVALAYEEALEMAAVLRRDWPYLSPDGAVVESALPDWKAKNMQFLASVLGPARRAAFKGAGVGDNALERLEADAQHLCDLSLSLTPDVVRVDAAGLQSAVERRRQHEARGFLKYDHSRPEPVSPLPPTREQDHLARQFSRRDDRGELAQRCHMLAGSVERWIRRFDRNRAETTVRMTEEWLTAEPGVDLEEARRKAEARFEKDWELDFSLRYGEEARELFTKAWEEGEIAKEHERLAIRPLASQFEEVPTLFNEIAESLYAAAEKTAAS